MASTKVLHNSRESLDSQRDLSLGVGSNHPMQTAGADSVPSFQTLPPKIVTDKA